MMDMKRILVSLICLGWVLTAPACGRAGTPVGERLKPPVTDLYLNARNLKEIGSEIVQMAGGYGAVDEEEQMRYLHQVYLFMEKARLVALSQYELLSLHDAIRPESLPDYYVLRRRSLEAAMDETADAVRRIRVYLPFLIHADVAGRVQEGAGVIDGNIYLMEKIMDLLPLPEKRQ